MDEDPLDFLGQPTSSPKQDLSNSIDPLEFLGQPKKSIGQKDFREGFENFLKSPTPKGRNIGADILTTGTSFAGLPGDIASFFTGDNPVTSENLRKKAFELIPSLAPETEKEKEWDQGLSTVMGLATPTGIFKSGAKLLGKGASKAVPASLKGKYRELFDLGKELGIDEKALAPFRHGRVTGSFLKAASKLGNTAREGVKFAEKLATPLYDKLYSEGGKIPLNQISKRGVEKGLQGIINEIQKSPALVNESKDVVKFLSEAIQGLKSNPNATVETLMALQKEAGKSVNWKSIKQAGKGRLIMETRDAIMKGIYGMNPSLGRRFAGMDKLTAGYKNLAKEVTPSKLVDFATKGGPFGYLIISLLTGHDFGESATKAASAYFGKKGIEKISGKLLTDPKWVGIKEKLVKTIKDNAFDKIPKMLIALKKKDEMDNSKYDF